MLLTLEHIMDSLETRLPAALISAATFSSIKDVCRLLPNGITYGLGFESRLTEPTPEVDFILRPVAPTGVEIIANQQPDQRLPESFAQNGHWSRVQDLCRSWAVPGSLLRQATFCLWIEIDAEQSRQVVPSPSLVFVQLQRSCCRRELYEPIASSVCQCLKGVHLESAIADNLHRCADLMPEKGLITLLGMSVARPTNALRIVVGDLDPDQIPDYAAAVGWKGRVKELEGLLFSLAGYADRHSINIDLDHDGIGKIGIEFGIPQENEPASDPRWEKLLEFLVRQGWCREEKRRALLAWPQPLTIMGDKSQVMQVRRFISHIKLTIVSRRHLEVKAYVGLVW